ncbi:MAG: hypothetical protein HAW62_06870 [Endozoicomonadaceae bacterium]|nr:hypothetical protein [Endozoicomonadaceae bacterium]
MQIRQSVSTDKTGPQQTPSNPNSKSVKRATPSDSNSTSQKQSEACTSHHLSMGDRLDHVKLHTATAKKHLYDVRQTIEDLAEPELAYEDCLSRPAGIMHDLTQHLLHLSDPENKDKIDIIDQISGKNPSPVLSNLYKKNKQLALLIIENRIMHHMKSHKTSFLTTWLTYDSNPAVLKQQLQKIQDALHANPSQPIDFDEILQTLYQYEKKQGILPYELILQSSIIRLANLPESQTIQSFFESESVDESIKPDSNKKEYTTQIRHTLNTLIQRTYQTALQSTLKKAQDALIQQDLLQKQYSSKQALLMEICTKNTKTIHTLITQFYKKKRCQSDYLIPDLPLKSDPESLVQYIITDPNLSAEFDQEIITEIYQKKCHQLLTLHIQQKEPPYKTTCLTELNTLLKTAYSYHAELFPEQSNQIKLYQAEYILQVLNQNPEYEIPTFWDIALTQNIGVKDIQKALSSKNTAISKSLEALRQFLFEKKTQHNTQAIIHNLELTDKYMMAQINYYFEKAQQCIDATGMSTPELKERFMGYLDKIATLESCRPNAASLKSANLTQSLLNIGLNLLKENEYSVAQRLKNIHIEYQLKKEHHYDSKEELSKQIPNLTQKSKLFRSHTTKKLKELMHQLITNPTDIVGIATSIFSAQSEVYKDLLYNIDSQLKSFAILCQKNPVLARALIGNIAQVYAILKTVAMQESELFSLFSQFEKRIQAESLAVYTSEAFKPNSSDLSTASPEEIDSLKRIYAWCDLCKYAPLITKTAIEGARVLKNACTESFLMNGVTMIKSLFSVAATQFIQNNTSKLSNEEVKAINTTLLSARYGVAEASNRIHRMQQVAGIMSDSLGNKSIFYSGVKAFLHPITTRFTRWISAYNRYRPGDSKWDLFSETLKMTVIFGPILIGLLALPILAPLSAFIGDIYLSHFFLILPTWTYISTMSMYKWDPLSDVVLLTTQKATKLLESKVEDLTKEAVKDAKDAFKSRHYQSTLTRLTFIQFYDDNPDIIEQNQALIMDQKEKIRAERQTEHYQKNQTALCQSYHELNYLNTILSTSQAIDRDLLLKQAPVSLHSHIPIDSASLSYWASARVQQLNELFLSRLGTDQLPENEVQLIEQITTIEEKVIISNLLMEKNKSQSQSQSQSQPSVAIHEKLEQARTIGSEKLQSALSRIYVNAYTIASQKVIEHAIHKTVGNHNMSARQFEYITDNKHAFNYKTELKNMGLVYKKCQAMGAQELFMKSGLM